MNKNKKFDFVILDLTIPGGMGGLETLKGLLQIDRDAYCIVSSGYATGETMSDYKKIGFKGALAKPYSLLELKKIIGVVRTP